MVRLRRPGRALARDLDAGEQAQDAAALRREPAPAGGALRARRPARARRRPGRAGAGQGAQLQQSQRRQCRARARLRVPRRRADGRHRQARQPVRRRDARAVCSMRGREALACDSVSAFGGIVATNRTLDAATAEAITEIFTEVVVAPDADEDAKAIFARKKNLRLLLTGELPDPRARRPDARGDRRRAAGPGPRQRHGHARPAQVRHQAPADRAGTARLPVRLDRRQARQVERDRLCEGRSHRRHRRRPDEPPRQRAHRRDPGRKRPRRTAGPSRARSAQPSRPTPSSPSPTACSPRPKRARPP